MSRMTCSDWRAYAVLRNNFGKQAAEDYRHMRNIQHRSRGDGSSQEPADWTIVKDYGIDGYLAKSFFPGYPNVENLKDDLWIEPVYSPYDCTGCLFSCWIECFRVPGGVWVYHRVRCDI